ncbi:MAG TPA: immunoglobulin domain-containing protein, partial [Candidatus Hydrogenedentes bacterium]|nr:immunoglobulin domain-containing protein [Candidatus Hydrogenedentota bacterium]
TYSSRKATLTVVGLLTIINQPQSVAVQIGQTVTLAVTAGGGVQPLRYTWRKNGVDIPNANGPTYIIPSVQLADAAGYSCQIRDDRTQSVTSETAVVRITESLPAAGMPGLMLLSAVLTMCGGVWIARRRALV